MPSSTSPENDFRKTIEDPEKTISPSENIHPLLLYIGWSKRHSLAGQNDQLSWSKRTR